MDNIYNFSQTPSFYHKRAQAKSLEGQYFDALFMYRKAYEERPDEQAFAMDYAQNYSFMGCFQESNNVLLTILYNDSEELPPDYYYIMGCNFTGMRCFGAALDCFECYCMGVAEKGEALDAAETMMEALHSGDVMCGEDLELFFLTARDDVRAIIDMIGRREYEAAMKRIDTEMSDMKLWTMLMNYCAMSMYENNLSDAAEAVCLRVLERKPDDTMALCHSITMGLREFGRQPDEKTLQRLLELEPATQEEYMCAAGTFGLLGLDEQALKLLLRLMDFQPNNREYLHNLAVCHYNCGSYDKALAVWSKLQKLYPMSVVADYYIKKADEAIKTGGTDKLGYGYTIPIEVFMSRLTELTQSASDDDELLKYLYYAAQSLPMPFQTLAIANTVRIRSAKKAKMFLHELLFYPRVKEAVKSYAKIYLELDGEYFDHYAASPDGVSNIPSPITDAGDVAPYTRIVWLILNGIDEINLIEEQQRAVMLLRTYMQARTKNKMNLGFTGMESAFAAACEYLAANERKDVTQAGIISKYQTTVYRFKKALENIASSLDGTHNTGSREGENDE